MITLQAITQRNSTLFKEIRLKALQESPSAFGSTYARESQFSDAEWARRIERWNGHTGIGYLALDGSDTCGLAGALIIDEQNPNRIDLVSMWTAPTHRRKGVGHLLVEEILRWVFLKNCLGLHLMVTSNNAPAIRFYERLGFTRTGNTAPYPNDSSLIEYEMFRPISKPAQPAAISRLT